MARPSKIPERLHADIQARIGDGKTYAEVLAWLQREHSIRVSKAALSRLMAERKAERAQATQAILQERLAPQVIVDIERLEKHAAHLDDLAEKLYDRVTNDAVLVPDGDGGVVEMPGCVSVIGRTPAAQVYAGVVLALEKVTSRKLELAGAGKTEGEGGASAGAPLIYVPPETED